MPVVTFHVPFIKFRKDIFDGVPNKQLFDKQQGVAAATLNRLMTDGTVAEKYATYGAVISRMGAEAIEADIAVAPDGRLVGSGGIISKLAAHEADAVLSMTSVLSVALSADDEGRTALLNLLAGLVGNTSK